MVIKTICQKTSKQLEFIVTQELNRSFELAVDNALILLDTTIAVVQAIKDGAIVLEATVSR